MEEGKLIFLWSIADAWSWFIHVPVLGFLIMAFFGAIAFILLLAAANSR